MTTHRQSWMRNLLVGKEHIPSRREFKYALLRGQFGFIIIFIAIFYIILDSINGIVVFLPWYILMAGIAFIGILFNRRRKYNLSSSIIMVMINLMVFLFADVDHPHGGVFFFFLPCAIAALILFHDYHRYLGFAFASFSVLLGYLAYTTSLDLMPPPVYKEGIIQINFLSNFTLGMFTCIFIVQFLINRNEETESSLSESEQGLLKTSDELRKSEERYALALKGTKAGIYEWNVETGKVYLSDYWKTLLGYEPQEMQTMSLDLFLTMIHPADAQRTAQAIQDHLLKHLPYQTELRLRMKNGEYKWFQDSGISKIDEQGKVQMVIGSIIDIDDRKRAAEEVFQKNIQLAKTNEELDRFVYSASHDMRAPLSSLLGLINISEKTMNVEEVHSYMVMMKERIKTMEGFIREITDYSRNARLELEEEEILLHPLVAEIVKNLAYIVKKPVRTEIRMDKGQTIKSDRNRLKVIMNNLISNAYKYHRLEQEDPSIIVCAGRENGSVHISIQDNGQGIPTEHHDKIFDMFYRASENSEGSGLGLYIVRETLQKLGGAIRVESIPGKGSTFILSFRDR